MWISHVRAYICMYVRSYECVCVLMLRAVRRESNKSSQHCDLAEKSMAAERKREHKSRLCAQ